MALAEIRAARASGARALFMGEAGYPPALMDVEGAPPMLWALGDPALALRPAVALVGARDASSLGLRMARRLAGELAEAGFVVVSGLARGIDAAAHRAALPGGTIAVMAGGADVVYPPENADLAAEVARRGLILSERPMGHEPRARDFPRRNRIVSGLALGLVVVEAAARSGSLITARAALDQGREVLAVPGHPFDARASGCNMLIRDGARLARGAADVIEALGDPAAMGARGVPMAVAGRAGPDRRAGEGPGRTDAAHAGAMSLGVDSSANSDMGQGVTGPLVARRRTDPAGVGPPRGGPAEAMAIQAEILSLVGPSPMAEDHLIRDLGRPVEAVLPEILALELDGRIERRPGGYLARVA